MTFSTVAELIKILQDMPQDAPIVTSGGVVADEVVTTMYYRYPDGTVLLENPAKGREPVTAVYIH